mgnify:CR=1 FL=1
MNTYSKTKSLTTICFCLLATATSSNWASAQITDETTDKKTTEVQPTAVTSSSRAPDFDKLWQAHLTRNADLQFIAELSCHQASKRTLLLVWANSIGHGQGNVTIGSVTGAPFDVIANKYPLPEFEGKPILSQHEQISLQENLVSSRDKLALALHEYKHTGDPAGHKKARKNLLDMCGSQAIEELDASIPNNNNNNNNN